MNLTFNNDPEFCFNFEWIRDKTDDLLLAFAKGNSGQIADILTDICCRSQASERLRAHKIVSAISEWPKADPKKAGRMSDGTEIGALFTDGLLTQYEVDKKKHEAQCKAVLDELEK